MTITLNGKQYPVMVDHFIPCALIDCVKNVAFYTDINGFYFAVIHEVST